MSGSGSDGMSERAPKRHRFDASGCGDGSSNSSDDCPSSLGGGGASGSLPQESPHHGMKLLHGLDQLKKDKVLCDVTLTAESMYT